MSLTLVDLLNPGPARSAALTGIAGALKRSALCGDRARALAPHLLDSAVHAALDTQEATAP